MSGVCVGLGAGCGTRAPGDMRGDADANPYGIARLALVAMVIDQMTRDQLAETTPSRRAEDVAEQLIEGLECAA